MIVVIKSSFLPQKKKVAGTEKQNPSEPVTSTADITTENSNSDAAVKEVTFSIHEYVHVLSNFDNPNCKG